MQFQIILTHKTSHSYIISSYYMEETTLKLCCETFPFLSLTHNVRSIVLYFYIYFLLEELIVLIFICPLGKFFRSAECCFCYQQIQQHQQKYP